MSVEAVQWAREVTDIRNPARAVLWVLAWRADARGFCPPTSSGNIADEAGLNRGTVHRCLDTLEDVGAITGERQSGRATAWILQLGKRRFKWPTCRSGQQVDLSLWSTAPVDESDRLSEDAPVALVNSSCRSGQQVDRGYVDKETPPARVRVNGSAAAARAETFTAWLEDLTPAPSDDTSRMMLLNPSKLGLHPIDTSLHRPVWDGIWEVLDDRGLAMFFRAEHEYVTGTPEEPDWRELGKFAMEVRRKIHRNRREAGIVTS